MVDRKEYLKATQDKRSKPDSWITLRGNSLIWQCTPSKPGWHLQMYSLKTSPRLVGEMTSQDPSFLQGLGLQGPNRQKERSQGGVSLKPITSTLGWKKVPLCCTCLCQVAGVSSEAISTDADERIISHSCHTRCSVMAKIHLTVITWTKQIQRKNIKYKIWNHYDTIAL